MSFFYLTTEKNHPVSNQFSLKLGSHFLHVSVFLFFVRLHLTASGDLAYNMCKNTLTVDSITSRFFLRSGQTTGTSAREEEEELLVDASSMSNKFSMTQGAMAMPLFQSLVMDGTSQLQTASKNRMIKFRSGMSIPAKTVSTRLGGGENQKLYFKVLN